MFVVLGFTAFSQEKTELTEKERASKVETKTPAGLNVTEALFLNNQIPVDLPVRSDYNSDEIYKKVIQGYINVNPELINPAEAERLGFTMPELIEKTESQSRSDIQKARVRKEQISEEEKQLKEQREKSQHN